MPLRKSGSIVGLTIATVALSAAIVPSPASAGGLSSLFGGRLDGRHGYDGHPDREHHVEPHGDHDWHVHAAPDDQGLQGRRRRYVGLLARSRRRLRVGRHRLEVHRRCEGRLRERDPRGHVGKRKLMMPLNSTATSPSFCVDQTNPHFRFAYKIDNASLSGFVAYRRVPRHGGQGHEHRVRVVEGHLARAVAVAGVPRESPLASLLPLSSSNTSASVQLRIIALSPVDLVKDFSDAIIGGERPDGRGREPRRCSDRPRRHDHRHGQLGAEHRGQHRQRPGRPLPPRVTATAGGPLTPELTAGPDARRVRALRRSTSSARAEHLRDRPPRAHPRGPRAARRRAWGAWGAARIGLGATT